MITLSKLYASGTQEIFANHNSQTWALQGVYMPQPLIKRQRKPYLNEGRSRLCNQTP